MRLKHIDPMTLALHLAALYFVLGIFILIFSLLLGSSKGTPFDNSTYLMPLIYPLLGAASGAIMARVYNYAARYLGGVRIEIKEDPKP